MALYSCKIHFYTVTTAIQSTVYIIVLPDRQLLSCMICDK